MVTVMMAVLLAAAIVLACVGWSKYELAASQAREAERQLKLEQHHSANVKGLGLAWKERAEQGAQRAAEERKLLQARYDALLEHLTKMVSLAAPAPVVLHGNIPDPPSVSANDKQVAVALRDRETAPLKRPLRPGEEE